ncbi:monocopper oxidase-like protein SKU5 [Wolffia australiana]
MGRRRVGRSIWQFGNDNLFFSSSGQCLFRLVLPSELVLFLLLSLAGSVKGGDPYVYYEWDVSYLSVSPLGVKQQVIGINRQFPGPTLNVTTNWNVVVNVHNNLDESFLITWNGIQHRKNAWQDGVSGTNCPIPPGWNWTYAFQVKDQIGSFFYFPSINFHRAAGGYGGIVVNNRDIIPLPFGSPDGDVTLAIGDWYKTNFKDLRKAFDEGKEPASPDGVLFNGLGPYRYNDSTVPAGIAFETINVEPGKTYRFRVHNVGVAISLNFRIQNHNLLLVETEGSYTVQQNYTNMDIHVGQSYSFLVTMDQNASTDYYVVASPRLIDSTSGHTVSGVAILHYSNSQGPASGPLPDVPNESDIYASMNQARSIRWNVSASAARPNPQGSFRYGDITVTDLFVILNKPAELINGRWRRTLNGISYVAPVTPLKLAQQYDVPGVYKLDFPNKMLNRLPKVDTSLINGSYKGFVEIVFQNNDTHVHTYHLDGYAFFVVGMDYGVWTENSRGVYNKWDGVARCTAQVFPGAWTAILVYLDNAGIWNLRTQNLNSWYLGQELYVSVVNPESTEKSESPVPDNVLFCGELSSLQRQQSSRFRYSDACLIHNGWLVSLVGSLAWAGLLLSW